MLDGPDADLLGGSSDFYIAGYPAQFDDVHVFSWRADIACTYYNGRPEHHYLCDKVASTRTFSHAKGRISGYADDRSSHRDSNPQSAAPHTRAESDRGREYPRIGDQEQPRRQHWSPLRIDVLLERLRAPRPEKLKPALDTLQPDQYGFIAASTQSNLIVEGQPGTGKTIVATHRAAFLVGDDPRTSSAVDGRILLVGPTREYSEHVRQVVHNLAPMASALKVESVTELMSAILPEMQSPQGHANTTPGLTDWRIAGFAQQAASKCRKYLGHAPSLRDAYEFLRSNGRGNFRISGNHLKALEFSTLHPFEKAMRLRAYRPLLAIVAWEIDRPERLRSVGHMIVDEAQDISPLEWFFLKSINAGRRWTILGDFNQRRSEYTPADWAEVVDIADLGSDTPVHVLTRGYRSTVPILKFANRLLPPGTGVAAALQHAGPEPHIERVEATALYDEVRSQVDRLLAAYPMGSVAVIGVHTARLRACLGGESKERRMRIKSRVSRGRRTVMVMYPDSARGLEFDAVVVVDPSEFPMAGPDVYGPLYTSLTRANCELVVVHVKALPRALADGSLG